MDSSSTNYIQLTFVWIAILTFLPGLVANYADKYLPTLFLQIFRYGRANVSSSDKDKGFSFIKKIEVPKKWFYHCYLFGVFFQSLILFTVVSTYKQGNTTSWLKSVLSITGGNNRSETDKKHFRNSNAIIEIDLSISILALSLFLFQLSRRLYETLFVCVYSNTKMNLLHYVLTWTHYIGSMLALPLYSPGFSSSLATNDSISISMKNINLPQYVAILLFFYGSWVTYQAHTILANLRKGKGNKVVTMKHQIPRGGMFESVSCPNYWGEMIVYFSIALVFRFQNYTWNYVTLWVIANQVICGVMNHQWYLATFPDYPKNRKAVIPYLW